MATHKTHSKASHSKKHSAEDGFLELLEDKKTISYIFLGIGITLFILNITGMLATVPVWYSAAWFDLSVFSSLIIVVYAVYVITESK